MYQHLDEQKEKVARAKKADPNASFEDSLKARMEAFGGEEALPWIYRNDIERVWEGFLQEQNELDGLH
jgi:salicylate hydroxylase